MDILTVIKSLADSEQMQLMAQTIQQLTERHQILLGQHLELVRQHNALVHHHFTVALTCVAFIMVVGMYAAWLHLQIERLKKALKELKEPKEPKR